MICLEITFYFEISGNSFSQTHSLCVLQHLPYTHVKLMSQTLAMQPPETCAFDRENSPLPSFIKVCMHNIYILDTTYPPLYLRLPLSALSRACSRILLISAWCCYNCFLFLSWFVTKTQNDCNTDASSDSSHWDHCHPNLVRLARLMCLGSTLMKGLKLQSDVQYVSMSLPAIIRVASGYCYSALFTHYCPSTLFPYFWSVFILCS